MTPSGVCSCGRLLESLSADLRCPHVVIALTLDVADPHVMIFVRVDVNGRPTYMPICVHTTCCVMPNGTVRHDQPCRWAPPHFLTARARIPDRKAHLLLYTL